MCQRADSFAKLVAAAFVTRRLLTLSVFCPAELMGNSALRKEHNPLTPPLFQFCLAKSRSAHGASAEPKACSLLIGNCPHKPESSASVAARGRRSEEHTSELQSLMRISYAVFCLKKKTTTHEQY